MYLGLQPQQQSSVIARLRSDLDVTQGTVALKAGLDQSRVSRIEKGEVAAPAEVERVLDALEALGSKEAGAFKRNVSTIMRQRVR